MKRHVWWISLALAVAGCGKDPATCHAGSVNLSDDVEPDYWVNAIQPTPEGVAVASRNAAGHSELTWADGLWVLDDAGSVPLDQLGYRGTQLVASGVQRDGASLVEGLTWSFIEDGVAGETQSLATPFPGREGATFAFDDFVVHSVLSEDYELALLFADETGASGDWRPGPEFEAGRPWGWWATPTGVHGLGVHELDEWGETILSVEAVSHDTTGREISRWILDLPRPSYAVTPLASASMVLASVDGLQIVDADGVQGEADWSLQDSVPSRVESVTLLTTDEVVWLIEALTVPGGRNEIWVRRFDTDLVELAPGRTLAWSSLMRAREDTLVFSISRVIDRDAAGEYVERRYRRDLAIVQCTGARVPLAEVAP